MKNDNEIDAWPEPVDGAMLLDELKRIVERHCILPECAAEIIALWVSHTWAFESADHSPILALVSPEKRCGKTTTFNVINAMVRNPVSAANASPAAVYRVIEQRQPTLMIDEADTFLEASEELRGILNAGNSRQGAFVMRCGGPRFDQVEHFKVWCPKCITMIGRLPETMEDRSINIQLRRKTKEEAIARFNSRTGDALEPFRQKLARWSQDLDPDMLNDDPEMPGELNDRAQDNCRHLVSIADNLGNHWPQTVRTALVELHATRSDDGPGVMLLRDIKAVFADAAVAQIPSSILVCKLWEHSPEWSEYKGRHITAKGVSSLLKPFGIKAHRNRTGSIYLKSDFEDAWKRYV